MWIQHSLTKHKSFDAFLIVCFLRIPDPYVKVCVDCFPYPLILLDQLNKELIHDLCCFIDIIKFAYSDYRFQEDEFGCQKAFKWLCSIFCWEIGIIVGVNFRCFQKSFFFIRLFKQPTQTNQQIFGFFLHSSIMIQINQHHVISHILNQ